MTLSSILLLRRLTPSMNKKFFGRIFGLAMIAISSLSLAISSFAWFSGPGTELDKKLDGQIGMRGYFYSGDGSAAHPFEIVSPVHFYNLTRLQNLGVFSEKKHFQIGHNFEEHGGLKCIDPETGDYVSYLDMSTISQSTPILPIGNEATPFVGDFIGNGIPVKNLKVSGYPEDIGVFGYVSCTGLINGLVCDNLEVCSLGYTRDTSTSDYELFHSDLDYIFTTAEALFTSSHYLSNDMSLSVYKYNGSSYTQNNLKHPNGIGGTALSNLNLSTNRDGFVYTGAYFKPTFPAVNNDPFTYSWQASSPIIKEETVLDTNGDNQPDKAIVIDMTTLSESDDFNSGGDMQANVRISLVASTEIDGYVFSRVIQTYVIEFYSNGDIFAGDGSVGSFSAAIFCDYTDDVTVGYRTTNYHHGNNVGFLAGHVDGKLIDSYVYNSKITFNGANYTPILTESDTGLVGEIGTNVVNGIDPDLGLVNNGDIGIINFSRIYSLIRDDMSAGQTVIAGKEYWSNLQTRSNYIAYTPFIDQDSETFQNYEKYMRKRDRSLQFGGGVDYITLTNTDMASYSDTAGITLTNRNIQSDFNSIDFSWNKVIEDEEGVDRGLGVFKIVTSYHAHANDENYNSYFLDNIGDSRIMNGTPKTKVYFSTAELNGNDAWTNNDRALHLPTYSDIHSFKYPFSRDFNYVFELDLADMALAGNNNYMYNTDSNFLANYLGSKLIDKYGAPIARSNPRFGFMFLSDQNERLESLSSYMPLKRPDTSNEITHNGIKYPTKCISFSIENDNGANVSVVGSNADISIYSHNTVTGSISKLYTMRSAGNNETDVNRYFTYDVETGETSTEVVKLNNMDNDNTPLYGHIFNLPKGHYCIGSSSDAEARLYFLAVQGQTEATIGSKDIADIGNSIEKVNFLTSAPTFADFNAKTLAITDLSFKGNFDDSVNNSFIVSTVYDSDEAKNCLALNFSDTPQMFVTYLLTYSPTKQTVYINGSKYKDINVLYRS